MELAHVGGSEGVVGRGAGALVEGKGHDAGLGERLQVRGRKEALGAFVVDLQSAAVRSGVERAVAVEGEGLDEGVREAVGLRPRGGDMGPAGAEQSGAVGGYP